MDTSDIGLLRLNLDIAQRCMKDVKNHPYKGVTPSHICMVAASPQHYGKVSSAMMNNLDQFTEPFQSRLNGVESTYAKLTRRFAEQMRVTDLLGLFTWVEITEPHAPLALHDGPRLVYRATMPEGSKREGSDYVYYQPQSAHQLSVRRIMN